MRYQYLQLLFVVSFTGKILKILVSSQKAFLFRYLDPEAYKFHLKIGQILFCSECEGLPFSDTFLLQLFYQYIFQRMLLVRLHFEFKFTLQYVRFMRKIKSPQTIIEIV